MKLKKTLLALAIVGVVATAGYGVSRSLAAKQDKPCACCTCESCACDPCTCCSCSSCSCGS
ncbi:MAG: hypothetical protein IPH09_17380 [bacterium]|nr:hypothetical protein [bacterium]